MYAEQTLAHSCIIEMLSDQYLKALTKIFEEQYVCIDPNRKLSFEISYEDRIKSAEARASKKADYEAQIIRDWPRRIQSKYSIAGVPIYQLNGKQAEGSLEDIKFSLKQILLVGLNEKYRDAFIEQAILHFHQGGLIHNTGALLSAHYQAHRMDLFNDKKTLRDITTLGFQGDNQFYPIQNGIGIIERNVLKTVHVMKKGDAPDEVKEYPFDNSNPVEIMTFSSIRYDMRANTILISKPRVEVAIRDASFYDLLEMLPREDTVSLTDRLWEKGANATSKVLGYASLFSGSLTKGMGSFLKSEAQKVKEQDEEVTNQAQIQASIGQCQARLVMLREVLDRHACLDDSLRDSALDKHRLFLDPMSETDALLVELETLLKDTKRKHSYIKRIQAWQTTELQFTEKLKQSALECRQKENAWADQMLQSVVSEKEDIEQKRHSLLHHYDVLPEIDKLIHQKTFDFSLAVLSAQMSELVSQEERLRQFLKDLPHKKTIEETIKQYALSLSEANKKLQASISTLDEVSESMRTDRQTLHYEKIIDMCQSYDVMTLSIRQTLSKLKALNIRMRYFKKTLEGYLETLAMGELIESKEVDKCFEEIQCILALGDEGERCLLEGKNKALTLLRDIEMESQRLSKIRENKAVYDERLLTVPHYTTDELQKLKTICSTLPTRPILGPCQKVSIKLDTIQQCAKEWDRRSKAHQATGNKAALKKNTAYLALMSAKKSSADKILHLIQNYYNPKGGRLGLLLHWNRHHFKEAETLYHRLYNATQEKDAFKAILREEIIRTTLDENRNYEGSYFRRLMTAYNLFEESKSPIPLLKEDELSSEWVGSTTHKIN